MVKIADYLSYELSIPITRIYLRTDSSITLSYINNSSRRFQVFVANRISRIHQLSQVDEWHYVSGKNNPADIISRGTTIDKLDREFWFHGPKFLNDYKCSWSVDTFVYSSGENMEIKGEKRCPTTFMLARRKIIP